MQEVIGAGCPQLLLKALIFLTLKAEQRTSVKAFNGEKTCFAWRRPAPSACNASNVTFFINRKPAPDATWRFMAGFSFFRS